MVSAPSSLRGLEYTTDKTASKTTTVTVYKKKKKILPQARVLLESKVLVAVAWAFYRVLLGKERFRFIWLINIFNRYQMGLICLVFPDSTPSGCLNQIN